MHIQSEKFSLTCLSVKYKKDAKYVYKTNLNLFKKTKHGVYVDSLDTFLKLGYAFLEHNNIRVDCCCHCAGLISCCTGITPDL